MKALIIAAIIVAVVVVLLVLNWRISKREDRSADGSIGGPS
jgi:hypothetical protein